jgi:hypothetical protein
MVHDPTMPVTASRIQARGAALMAAIAEYGSLLDGMVGAELG